MAAPITTAMTLAFRHDVGTAFSDVLRAALQHQFAVAARCELPSHDENSKFARLVLSGYICRYRTLMDGRRQITALLLPGDICDVETVLAGKANYGLSALTAARLGELRIGPHGQFDDLDPELRQLLLRQVIRDGAISREWVLVLGKLNALERMAHLFCELWIRLRSVGLADAGGCKLDFTQNALGEILGLSSVHVNRTLQELRRRRLIDLTRGYLHILEHPELAQLANFDPAYLDR